jgi:hypothetical protein
MTPTAAPTATPTATPIPTATPTGWDRYRQRQRALSTAAAAAARGGDATAAWSRVEGAGAFASLAELALAAQEHWWQRLLARIDAAAPDDIGATPATTRQRGVEQAWIAQRHDASGYLALAEMGAGDPAHASAERRYARVLALFAGRAAVTDSPEEATAAGVDLVRELRALPTADLVVVPADERRRRCRVLHRWSPARSRPVR